MFLQKWIVNLQDLPQNQSPETVPICTILAQAIFAQDQGLHCFCVAGQFFCVLSFASQARRSFLMVRRGWSTVEVPSGWLQVIRGPRPPAARWPSAHKGSVQRSPSKPVITQPVLPQDACRRQKPSEVRAAASTRISRLQGAVASLGPDDTEERKVLEAALKKAKTQAAVPPVEDQIAMSVKFLERARKRLAVADTEVQAAVKKKSQLQRSGRHPSEAPKKLRSTFARRLPNGEWVVVQTELRAAQVSSPGGSPRWRVLFHHRPHSRTWCREESDKVGIQGHQSGRGVPPRSSPFRKHVGR